MDDEYYFYILNNPYVNQLRKTTEIPIIRKVLRNQSPYYIKFNDVQFCEGPYGSIFELKKKSLIFGSVKSPKLREKILKNKNIVEIVDIIFTDSDKTYDKAFVDSLYHTLVGQISKGKASGVHFYNPNRVRIIDKLFVDTKTDVFSAKIEILNENTGCWVEKDDISTFFPNYWTVDKLFHECSFAYENKVQIADTERTFCGKTLCGILVKFIFDEKGSITTFYPILNIE